MSIFQSRRAGTIAVICTFALLASACSSSSSSSGSKGSTPSTGAGGLQTRSTSIGTVLVNSAGRTVYELDGDTAANPTCTGGCQAIWPPVMASGSQLIINGHPAFTFTQDGAAGQTNGQNVRDQWGHWAALDANGNPITGTGAAPTTPATSGGGYKY